MLAALVPGNIIVLAAQLSVISVCTSHYLFVGDFEIDIYLFVPIKDFFSMTGQPMCV